MSVVFLDFIFILCFKNLYVISEINNNKIICRMRVFMATFDHIHSDIDKFVDGRHFQVVRETLKDFPLKLAIICQNVWDKASWV